MPLPKKIESLYETALRDLEKETARARRRNARYAAEEAKAERAAAHARKTKSAVVFPLAEEVFAWATGPDAKRVLEMMKRLHLSGLVLAKLPERCGVYLSHANDGLDLACRTGPAWGTSELLDSAAKIYERLGPEVVERIAESIRSGAIYAQLGEMIRAFDAAQCADSDVFAEEDEDDDC